MSQPLLRRFYGSLLLLVLLVLGARPAQASHFLGGEMNYRYLDANGPVGTPFRYEITVTVYINALPGTPGQPVLNQNIFVFNRNTGVRTNVNLTGTISPVITGEIIMETFGLKPSRQVGELKEALMEAILDGTIKNEMEPALAFLLQQGGTMGLAPEGGLVHSPN